jgi:putative DNA primase/helicase
MTDAAHASELHANSGVAGVAGVAPDLSDCVRAGKLPNEAPQEVPHIPDGCGKSTEGTRYELTDSGVYYVDDDGERHWLATPIQVIAASRDADSKRWGRLFLVADPDGRKHCVPIPSRQFVGDGCEALRTLADHGAGFAPSRKSRERVLDYLQTAQVAARVEIVDTCGWHTLATGETVFVLGDRVLGAAAKRVLYEPETRQVAFMVGGTADGWRTEVAAPCAGNSRLAFAVCVALAGTLLYVTGDESGGIHFVGSSSTGKTTALYAAGSVWGGHAFLRRWRATANAIDAQAAQHCDTLLVLDELAQVDPKDGGGIAYSLANGQGKARANRTGTAKPVQSWRVLFLSAGEIGLAQHMAEGGKRTRAGQETRLAEIPADAGAGLGVFDALHDAPTAAAFANRLRDATGRHYGHVGPAFVQRLLDERESWTELAATVKELGTRFAGDGADGQVQRVARRFALIAMAGELATKWNLTGWPQGTATAAAQTCFNAWVATRGGKGNLEPKQVLAQVRAFLEQHGEARFASWDDDGRVTHNRAGFRRVADDGRTRFYVLREAMRRELLSGLNVADALRTMADAGVLDLSTDGKATRPERLPGLGTVRCYVVNPALWDASSE